MEAGKFYHIYNRGNNKQDIFFEERNYHHFLTLFNKYLSAFVDVYAYCLMPNHFHFLIKIKDYDGSESQQGLKSESLSPLNRAFKYLFMAYAKGINNNYNRTGALFQQKFKRKEITDDRYFTEIIQYIHSNPLEAGLCKRYEDWHFSSYQAITDDKPTKINKEELLKWFGGKEMFIKIHSSRLR